ncbi:glyoxalase/bleomycin resistance protein/dioxygenase [Rhizobium sp. CCGE 510]|nr:glyoxalase/bleomycin resistance protein/dioxygenase [Rhizobium sp. CCGE 510]
MTVLRIVVNIQAPDITPARRFYRDILGLNVVMDHRWITTFGATTPMNVQLSIASEGGSGTPVPIFRSKLMISMPCSRRCRLPVCDRVWAGRRALGRRALLCARSAGQAGEHSRP